MPNVRVRLHRMVFRAVSLLSVSVQGRFLRRFFEWVHHVPDPWRYDTEPYEIDKYETTLRHVPRRAYRRVLDAGCSELRRTRRRGLGGARQQRRRPPRRPAVRAVRVRHRSRESRVRRASRRRRRRLASHLPAARHPHLGADHPHRGDGDAACGVGGASTCRSPGSSAHGAPAAPVPNVRTDRGSVRGSGAGWIRRLPCGRRL